MSDSTGGYGQTWAILTSLWSDWSPNDVAARMCADRFAHLDQAVLREASHIHRMEALGQYLEPKIHRLIEIYHRITNDKEISQPAQPWRTGVTEDQYAEWDRHTDAVLADVTEEELVAARQFGLGDYTTKPTPNQRRWLAAAVEFLRSKGGANG